MSTIPNSAMPHAIEQEPATDVADAEDAVARAKDALGTLVKDVEVFARGVGERLKGVPKGAQIAAGAVVVGGLVAAAAVPLVRAVRKPAAKPRVKTATARKPAAAKPKAVAKPKPPAKAPAKAKSPATRASKPKADASA